MIKRERYMKRIRPFIGNDLVKVITGMRRSGKSVMLELIKDELRQQGISDTQFITFNFESLSNAKYCNAEALYNELKKRISSVQGKCYLFFDEIQEVSDWEKCINSARIDFDCDSYITGTNARLLSGELATYLGGRYVEFTVYPFSFEEFLACRTMHGEVNINEEFRTYLYTGGMPFLANLNNNRQAETQYLSDLYNSIILKDVVQRNGIRNVDLLERIITFVLANVGHTFSARRISEYLKSEKRTVAPDTVLNYIKACCEAYLFFKISREDIPGKKILSVSEKYYVADHGLREAIFKGNERDIDQLIENIVCMEIIRRGYSVSIGKISDKEIDFIARKGRDRLYIQTAYILNSPETVEREFGVYDRVRDNFPKYVVSMDEFDMSRNGIRHINLRDFLLAEEWK